MAKAKILLVDDSGTSLMMGRMILQKGPYELVSARNGVEAVKMAVDERPDLILLDIVMPEMDGFEACRRIREMQETCDIPIIMVTTKGDEESVEQGFRLGCNDYLTKPINGFELMTKVKNVLSQ